MATARREHTRAFTELVIHYLCADRFGRPGKGNDKGKVKGLVKFSRSNVMTPIPGASGYDALDACWPSAAGSVSRTGQAATARPSARLAAVLRMLPAVAPEAYEKRWAQASSSAQARYRDKDYSVPTS